MELLGCEAITFFAFQKPFCVPESHSNATGHQMITDFIIIITIHANC